MCGGGRPLLFEDLLAGHLRSHGAGCFLRSRREKEKMNSEITVYKQGSMGK